MTIAIDAENLEMVELLVIMSVDTKDALLQAINAEFVEAVELLLEVRFGSAVARLPFCGPFATTITLIIITFRLANEYYHKFRPCIVA